MTPLPALAVEPKARRAGLDEISAADRLLEFRREAGDLRDTSFDTISGAGPNGAIVHYRVTPGDQPPSGDGLDLPRSIPAASIRTAPPTSPVR
jgi:Xaa-Pro aminopeptidase